MADTSQGSQQPQSQKTLTEQLKEAERAAKKRADEKKLLEIQIQSRSEEIELAKLRRLAEKAISNDDDDDEPSCSDHDDRGYRRDRQKRRKTYHYSDSEEDEPKKDGKVKEPRQYHGDSISQYRDHIRDCENAWRVAPGHFPNDLALIDWARQYVTGQKVADPFDRAYRSRFEFGLLDDPVDQTDWDWYKAKLLSYLGDEENIQTDFQAKWNDARQREGQSTAEFLSYLDSLEQHLPTFDENDKTYALRVKSKLSQSVKRELERLTANNPIRTREELRTTALKAERIIKFDEEGNAERGRARDRGVSNNGPRRGRYDRYRGRRGGYGDDNEALRGHGRSNRGGDRSRPHGRGNDRGRGNGTGGGYQPIVYNPRHEGLQCDYCQKWNHIARDCLTKQREEQRTASKEDSSNAPTASPTSSRTVEAPTNVVRTTEMSRTTRSAAAAAEIARLSKN